MIRLTITIFFMGILSWLFGCKDNGSSKTKTQAFNYENVKLEDITSRIDTTEGFYDIYLKIMNEVITDTTHIYIAKGLYKSRTVGLQFEVRSQIGAGIIDGEINNKEGFVSKGVQLKSIGQESDEFVKAMAELYNQPIPKSFSQKVISSTAFSLNENPVNLNKKDNYKFKLFFEEDDEDLYSEIFFNINTNTGEIELPEKDEEYRESLIKVWTK